MTLEENIQQLRDSLTVNSAMTVRHETRVKEHQKWLEDMELAFARMAAAHEAQERRMARFDKRMDQIAKADAERGRALDKRISNLASAIGKLISKRGSD